MASLGDLVVRVGASIDGFEKAMGTVSKRLSAIDREADQAFRGFDKIGDRLSGLGQTLTAGVTLPLAGIGIAATKMAADFELGIRKVGSLVGGFTDGELKAFEEGTLELSKRLGIDAVKATDALYEAISAGVPQDNVLAFLEVASVAAIAGVTDTKVAVDGLTSILNAYGLETEKAKEVSDAMFQSVNLGKFQFEDLAASISIATPLAAQLGVSFQDLLAAAATLTSQGFSVSEAMTSIRAAMVAIITPNDQMNTLLEKTGAASGQALISSRGLHGALVDLRSAAGGNVQVLTEALGRVEGLGAALGLTGDKADKASRDLESVRNSSQGAGASMLAFNAINQSTSRQFEALVANVKATAIELGVQLLPAVNNLLRASQPLIEFLSSMVQRFSQLPDSVQTTVIAFGAAVAALGPLLFGFGQIVSAGATVGTALRSMAGVLGLAGESMTLAGVAASGLTLGLIAVAAAITFDQIGNIGNAFDRLKSSLDGVFSSSEEASTSIVNLSRAFGFVTTETSVLSEAWEKLKSAFTNFDWKGALIGPLGLVDDFLNSLANSINIVRGRYPEMDKAIADSTETLKKHTEELMRIPESSLRAQQALSQQQRAHTDVGRKAEEAAKKLEKAGKETKKHATETQNATRAVSEHDRVLGIMERALGDAERALTDVRKAQQLGAASADDVARAEDRVRNVLQALHPEWRKQELAVVDVEAAYREMIDAVGEIRITAGPAAEALGDLLTSMDVGPVDDFTAAMRRQRIQSSGELRTLAENAARDYEAITASGLATKGEIEQAWLAMTKAARDYAESIGDVATANALDKQLEAHQSHGKAVAGVWDKAIQQVSTAWTDLSQKIVEGDFGSILDGLKGVGEAIARTFVEQGLAFVDQFIQKGLKFLLSHLDDILAKIPGIGGALADVLGGLGGTTGAIGSATGTATGTATSTAGGATTAAGSGLTPTLGAVFGGIAAAAGIANAIGTFRLEGTMNAVEANTRVTAIGILGPRGLLDMTFEIMAAVQTQARALSDWMQPAWAELLGNTDGTGFNTFWSLQNLQDIRMSLLNLEGYFSSMMQQAAMSMEPMPLLAGAEAIPMSPEMLARNGVIEFHSHLHIDGREVAESVVRYMEESGTSV